MTLYCNYACQGTHILPSSVSANIAAQLHACTYTYHFLPGVTCVPIPRDGDYSPSHRRAMLPADSCYSVAECVQIAFAADSMQVKQHEDMSDASRACFSMLLKGYSLPESA